MRVIEIFYRRDFKRFYLLISLFAVLGCVSIYNPATGKKEFYFIDEGMERLLGKQLASSILSENKTINDEKVLTRLNMVGEKIVKVSDRNNIPYHFYVIDDKDINAFALPGGYIFVNKGLLDSVNDEELAFVLGHEVGHVCARHSVKKLQIDLGMSVISSIVFKENNYAEIRRGVDTVYKVVSLGYSRQDEFLADKLGVKYMVKAGYSYVGALNLLQKLKKYDKDNRLSVFLRSHPLVEDRISHIKNYVKEELEDAHNS